MNYYLIIPRCWGTDTYSQGLTAGLGINKITPSYLQYRCNPFSKRISSELSQSFQCAMLGFPKIGLPPVIIGFSMKQTSQLLGSPHDFGIIHFCHRIFYYKPSILDTSIYGNPQIQPTSYRMAERGGYVMQMHNGRSSMVEKWKSKSMIPWELSVQYPLVIQHSTGRAPDLQMSFL